MSKDHYYKARQAATSITGQRFCTNCRMNQRAEGGLWKTVNNGRNRRWKCQLCVDSQIRAAASNADISSGSSDSHIADSLTSQPAVR